MKEKLLGKNLAELQAAAEACGLKPFVGKQLADWLYAKRVRSWARMVNISKAGREALAARFELGTSYPVGTAQSSDGTRKYLFPVREGFIESVVIPDAERKTLCVSSQAGCRMGCKFCMTGRGGYHGQLDAADILNQFISIE